ncbi:hypothetical protein QOZ95_000772 [Paenibacillus brasilensis]|uniref:ABC transporter permease n=1 Tax=Paenibacillus brasilensis TaxID=128574 RepID=A0ABU0KWK5_9BACL|nr:hypothetical protein [Paenibacillus brasilensis]
MRATLEGSALNALKTKQNPAPLAQGFVVLLLPTQIAGGLF